MPKLSVAAAPPTTIRYSFSEASEVCKTLFAISLAVRIFPTSGGLKLASVEPYRAMILPTEIKRNDWKEIKMLILFVSLDMTWTTIPDVLKSIS
jgi:hypothetical protein